MSDGSSQDCLDLVAKVLVKSMDTATPTAETRESTDYLSVISLMPAQLNLVS